MSEEQNNIVNEKINILTKLWYLIATHFVSKKGMIYLAGTVFLAFGMIDGWEWLALGVVALLGLAADNHSTTKKSDWQLINELKAWKYIKLKVRQMLEFGPFMLLASGTGMFIGGAVDSQVWVSAASLYIGINIFDAIRGKFEGFSSAYQLINQNRSNNMNTYPDLDDDDYDELPDLDNMPASATPPAKQFK